MSTVLKVTMFGSFSMRIIATPSSADYQSVTEQETASSRLWSFLKYLCLFHSREVTQEELIEALWGDEELSDPVNALKTMLHRARHILEEVGFPDGKKILLYRHGIYSWSPDVEILLDSEEFDSLSAAFEGGSQSPDDVDNAVAALALYRGDLLAKSENESWILSMQTYYHMKYMQLSFNVSEALWRLDRIDQAVDICRTATTLDPYEESCQLMLMQLLHASGSTPMALRHYSHVSKLLMDNLGVSPSKEMTDFYNELAAYSHTQELDLRVIRDNLSEHSTDGALYCEYTVFANIYRLLTRSMSRNGQTIELGVITLFEKGGKRLESRRAEAAQQLHIVIQSSLRASDVFTRFSPNQYLVLLPGANHENATMVMGRILTKYSKTEYGRSTSPEFSLLPAVPVELDNDESFAAKW